MERPTEKHLAAVKRIVRYMVGTIYYGYQYGRDEHRLGLVTET
jgi:hypothetical protein